MSDDHYPHFCTVISKGPATGLQDTAEMVMGLSCGQADPDQIAVWWAQWQLLRQAMRDNHPMVKLAAALCPGDPAAGIKTIVEAPIEIVEAQGIRDPSTN